MIATSTSPLLPDAQLRGQVKVWFLERGFGFITLHDPDLRQSLGPNHFVHISNVIGSDYLCDSDEVLFELERDDRGRTRAVRVQRLTRRG